PDFGDLGSFPGSPVLDRQPEAPPPPDAIAFYLPFHYFHPTWWGIYIVLERLHDFARELRKYSGYVLTFNEALSVGRLFGYSHEAFHHTVEAFATRLEITHRVPLYANG